MGAAIGDSEREALEALGYSEAWLEAGLLDRARLAEQLERLRANPTIREKAKAWVLDKKAWK